MRQKITLALTLVLVVGSLPTAAMAGTPESALTASTNDVDVSNHDHDDHEGAHAHEDDGDEDDAGSDSERHRGDEVAAANATVDTAELAAGTTASLTNASEGLHVELGYARPSFDLNDEPPVLELDYPCWAQQPMPVWCFQRYRRIVLDEDPL